MTNFKNIAVEFDLSNYSIKTISLKDLTINPEEKNKIYWIHSNLNQTAAFKKIATKLKLPAHITKLCTEERSLSHLINDNESITLQIKCLTSYENMKDYAYPCQNMVIHLTSQYCFTASLYSMPILFDFLNNCSKELHYAKTSCFILFLFLEGIINDYAKILFNYEEVVDQFELQVENHHKNIYKEITEAKHQIMKVKHNIIAIREILIRILSRKISVISDPFRESLHSLSGHSHLLIHDIDSIRDLLNGLLSEIDNELMQNMSETMKVLAAFASIFLPLNLITGIYGMNFKWMPELSWKYGYFGALTLIGICGITLFFLFKKKKWM